MKQLILTLALMLSLGTSAQTEKLNKPGIAEGAIVMMADHNTKRIERINVGDRVLAYNDSKEFVAKKVTKVHSVQHRQMHKLRLRDGKTIVVTDGHPFTSITGWTSLNPSKTNGYARYADQKIKELKEGNTIKVLLGTKDTTSSEVIEIVAINKKTNTYTLELEDASLFVVNGILVGQE